MNRERCDFAFFTRRSTKTGGGGAKISRAILERLPAHAHGIEYDEKSGSLLRTLGDGKYANVSVNSYRRIVFENEYSYLAFVAKNPKFLETPIEKFCFVHDQSWKYGRKIKINEFDNRLNVYQNFVIGVDSPKEINFIVQSKNHVSKIKYDFLKRELNNCLKKTSKIITLTPFTAKNYKLMYADRAISVENRAWWTADFGKPKIYNTSFEGKSTYSFGRFSREKNLHFILRILKESVISHQHYFLGRCEDKSEWEYVEELKDLIKYYGFEDNVIIKTNPSDIELSYIINKSIGQICLQNCDFNLTIMESLALGKSVLVAPTYDFTFLDSHDDLIYCNQIIVGGTTLEEMKTALSKLLNNEGRRIQIKSPSIQSYMKDLFE